MREGGVAGEGLEDVPSLFSGRCDDGAEGGEVLSGVESAEGAGDFHLHLHHAQRLLGQVVGEGDVEVDEEAQGLVLEVMQPAQQVLSRPSLGLARWGLRKARQLAVEREPFAQDVPEAGVEALEKGWVERAFAPRFGVPDRPVGVEQEIAHGRKPTAPGRIRSAP